MSKPKVVQAQIAYGKPEELTNIISHALGAALSFVGLVFLMLKSTSLGYHARTSVAVFLYGLSMICMFTISTLYHCMRYGSTARAVFRRLDHCSISLIILGTYTPVMLVGMMKGTFGDSVWGYVLFALVAVLAVLNIVFNSINVTKFKIFGLVSYVVMGWACIVRIDRIAALCGYGCFWFLLGGGLIYSVGIIFYAVKKIPFNHAIWHFFVLGGAAMHFVCVYSYIL